MPARQRRRGRNAAMLSVVADDAAQAELRLDLDELFREGARRMLAVALEAEVDAYIAGYAEQVDDRATPAVPEHDPAPVGQAQPQGRRGAAAAVPARAQLQRLRPGAGGAGGV